MSERWWTEERDAELLRLQKERYSTARIAEVLGATSKNAVIGRLHRLGAPKMRRRSPVPRVTKPRDRLVVIRPAPVFVDRAPPLAPSIEPALAATPVPGGLSIWDMRSAYEECRFIIDGTGRHARYCADRSQHGSPYCAAHHRIVYVPVTKRAVAAIDDLAGKIFKGRAA